MKKLLLFIIIGFGLLTNSYAQKLLHFGEQRFYFGVQAGGGLSMAATDYSKKFTEFETAYLKLSKDYQVLSYGFNVYAGYVVNENWGIAFEPGFIRKGSAKKVSINNRIEKENTYLEYVHIPVLGEVFLSDEITLTVGPELSYLLNAKKVTGGKSVNVSEEYDNKKIDIGLQAGIYYTFNKRFDLGLKTGVSITRLDKFTMLNPANEVIAEYNKRNMYASVFFRVKLIKDSEKHFKKNRVRLR